MTCINCGCEMYGDGYTSVVICENVTEAQKSEEDIYFAAPDEGPYYCRFEEEEEVN